MDSNTKEGEYWALYYLYLEYFTNCTSVLNTETKYEALIEALKKCRENVELKIASSKEESKGLDGPRHAHRVRMNRIIHAYIKMNHDQLDQKYS